MKGRAASEEFREPTTEILRVADYGDLDHHTPN